MNLMSENINEIIAALAKAQGKIQPAAKDKANPFFKSKYADLSSVWDACRDALTENGLAVVQTINKTPDGMSLITTLGHSSGQWMRSEMPIMLTKTDPQSLGSIITYYRRYCLAAMTGVAPEDDDAEKAQAPYRNQKNSQPDPKYVEPKKMSPDQANELKLILSECDLEYVKWFNAKLMKNYNTQDFCQISAENFDNMKLSATRNMQENFSKNRIVSLQEEQKNMEKVQ